MIGLADCNNFFVSCERTRDSRLMGRPVVVLSNNDGCVVARSNEAKKMGVKMGQPAFQLKDEIKSNRLIALSGDHLLYRDLSIKVHDIFRRYAPTTIDYSIDEAFLDMEGIPAYELQAIGEAICNSCLKELKLPVTVGFAQTKTLAKIVTERCKKQGISTSVLADAKTIMTMLENIPISDLWGIGRRLSKQLYMKGVYTIGDFAKRDRHWVRALLGLNGERSWMELHGISCIELDFSSRQIQDSISESRTFPEDVSDFDYVRSRISIYAADCAAKLRKMKGVCGEFGVYMQTNPFRTDISRQTFSRGVTLPTRTDDSLQIVNICVDLLSLIWTSVPIKRAGVWLNDIKPKVSELPSLFDVPAPDHSRLMQTIDRINALPGKPAVKLATQITLSHPGHNDGYSSSFQAPVK